MRERERERERKRERERELVYERESDNSETIPYSILHSKKARMFTSLYSSSMRRS